MFFANQNGQKSFDYILLLLSINNKPKVGQINKRNFLSQLKDQRNDKSQFFLLDDQLLVNDLALNNNSLIVFFFN